MSLTNISFLAFTAIFLLYLIWSKKDILDTWDTAIRIAAASFILIIWIGIGITQAYLMLNNHFNGAAPTHQFLDTAKNALAVVLFSLPLFGFLYGMMNLRRFFKRKYKLEELETFGDRFSILKKKIEEFSNAIGLSAAPEILLSNKPNISPFVFGRSSRSASIVLPSNFEAVLEATCGMDSPEAEIRKTTLMKFVLLHELSHIKHGDVPFVSLFTILLSWIKTWLTLMVILLCVVIGGVDVGDLGSRSIAYDAVLFPAVIAMIGLYASICRSRELLADKRAAIFLTETESRILLQPEFPDEKRSESLIEFFLSSLSSLEGLEQKNSAGQSAVGAPSWVVMHLKTLFAPPSCALSIVGVRPVRWKRTFGWFFNETHPRLSDRKKALMRSERKYERYLSFESICFGAFSLGVSAVSAGILATFVPWTKKEAAEFFVSALWGTCFVSSMMLCLPYRNAVSRIKLRSGYVIGMLVRGVEFLACEAAAVLFFIVVTLTVGNLVHQNLALNTTETVNFSSIPVTVSTATIMITVLTLLALSARLGDLSPFLETSRNSRDVIVGFSTVVGFVVILFLLSSFVVTELFSLALWSPLFVYLLSRASGGAKYTQIDLFGTTLRVEYYSTPMRRLAGNNEMLIWTLLFLVGFAGFTLLIGELIQSVAAELGLENIFTGLGILLLLFLLFKLRSGSSARLDRLTEYYLDLGGSATATEPMSERLLANRLRQWKNLTTSGRAHMSKAYDTIPPKWVGEIPQKAREDLKNWVLSCEQATGGFGPWPGAGAEFDCSLKAILLLDRIQSVQDCQMMQHVSFIASFQEGDGGFSSRRGKSNLLDTHNALEALERIQGIGSCRGQACVYWLLSCFRRTELSPRDLYRVLDSLRRVNGLDTDTLSVVANIWWRPRLHIFKSLNYEEDPVSAYYFMKIAQYLENANIDASAIPPPDARTALIKRLERMVRYEHRKVVRGFS